MLHAPPKRTLVRFFSVLFVVMLLLSASPIATFAAETTNDQYIELDGTFTGTFELSSSHTQLFHLTNIAPGDSWSGTIHVKNSAAATMEFSVVSVVSNLEDTTLFDHLTTQITVDGETVYDGTYGFNSSNENMTPYFAIAPGETLDLEILVLLPKATGNVVMGKSMDSTWTFEARYYGSSYTVHYVDEYGNALAPRKTEFAPIGSTVTEEALDIEGYEPDETIKKLEIRDEDNVIVFVYRKIVSDDTPDTGDNTTGLTASMLLMVLSAVAIGVTYARYRALRKEQRKYKD